MQLLVRGLQLPGAVEDERAAGPLPRGGIAVDDAAHKADAGLGRRLGLGGVARPAHRLCIVVARFLRGWAPRIERDLRQDGQVGAASDRLGQAVPQPRRAVRLPEDLGDERDGQLPVLLRGLVLGWG